MRHGGADREMVEGPAKIASPSRHEFSTGFLTPPGLLFLEPVAQRRMTPPKNNPITMIGPTSVLRELGGGRRVEPQAED